VAKGAVAFKQRKLDEAISCYLRSLALRPGSVEVLTSLGAAYAVKRDFGAAEQSLREAIAVGPLFIEAYRNLGHTLRDQGKFAEAAQAYQQARMLSPEDNMSPSPQFNRLKQCRHGMMLYNINDTFIGRSLDLYGEFSEGEISLFQQLVKPGQTILEVGANIGAHTVWLAHAVGRTGTVLAFEPQRIVHQTLCANLALNNITNVQSFCAAVGKEPGTIVVPSVDPCQSYNFGGVGLGGYEQGEVTPVLTIDGLNLSKCHFLKIDVEGMELEVLQGAVRSIAAHWPIIYVENDRREKSESLIRFIDGLGYDMYWHTPMLYNPNNFSGHSENVFGQIVSVNMLCLPRAFPQRMSGFHPVQVPAIGLDV
jgi:FkbM family methyltransferase